MVAGSIPAEWKCSFTAKKINFELYRPDLKKGTSKKCHLW